MAAPAAELPDLRPNTRNLMAAPVYTLDPDTQKFIQGPQHLWFDTHAENQGFVPFDLLVEDMEPTATSTVGQCISWSAPYVCDDRAVVGGFTWHDEHKHFHYDDFADYQLRAVGVDGRADYSDAGLLRVSEKVSFCMVDSELVRPVPPSPPTYPQVCTATRQGISSGWTDIYTNDLPGQQFSLEGLGDGRYALIISLDPPGRLHETDRSNNTLEAIVEISNNQTAVTVVERWWH